MNARKFPRSLDQAFGPYHRSSQCPIEPMPAPMHRDDVIVIVASLIAVAALLVIFFYEWSWI